MGGASAAPPRSLCHRSCPDDRVRRERRSAPLFAQRSEARAHLLREELRLLPGSKMPAFVELVVMDESRKRPLCPASRGRIQVVRERAYSHRDGDALDNEKGERVLRVETLPVETAEEIAVFVNQVSVMLSRTSSRVRPSGCPAKARAIS